MGKVIKMIDLWNMVFKKEIKDKQKFRVTFENGMKNGMTRDIYYVESEGCNICCFRHCSNDFWWDEVFNLNDKVEILDEEEQEEIDIQKINKEDLIIIQELETTGENYLHSTPIINRKIMDIINNLIDEVKKLDKQLKEK